MKMGVMRSIGYMLKTIWDADKGCVIFSFYKNCTEEVFASFFVITMMQIIYGYIENGKPYMDLVKFVLLFCGLHVCIHLASAAHAYYIRLKTSRVYGHVFNKIIEKATHIELTRYEQPDFYDKFSKALDECLTKAKRIRKYVKRMVEGELGDIDIEHLTFTYAGAKTPVINDLSLRIKKGEHIALVGENGAGKTTFVKLLMRLYGATLAENVVMNHLQDGDSQKAKKALELADFGKKLERLPEGLETILTREFEEDGTMLSGGESQKVAISRMFAKSDDLAIAILDEPSSALDPLAEYKLNTNMMKQTKDSTIIFISHRLSTTKDADRIYMFEKQAHFYQDEIADDMSLEVAAEPV